MRQSIQTGITEGLGIDKIAKLVRSEMATATASRARTIAQTEVNTAANTAAMEGAACSGIEFRKFWSNSGLDGIRESHIFAQQWSYEQGGIDQSEYFDMGNGNLMLHPGDPEGPSEEVINCRCTLIVEPV